MIAVMQPDLPTADELLPVLRVIDANRQYTNDGPLVQELERELGGVCVANATLALEMAVRHVFRQGRVRVPALTFPATLTAVIRAGLEPVICDVREDFTVEPDARTLSVAAFGTPTQGPLVDAAGACMTSVVGNAVVSLHATKPLPAGEGAVVVGDRSLLEYIRRARNFGFEHGVVTHMDGTNAKMSEYHAAVGLLSRDRYQLLREKRDCLAARYESNLRGRVETRPYYGGTVYPVLIDSPLATAHRLAEAGIETRRWYCPTLDMHPAFKVPRESLPVAHKIAARLLCLPFHTFMTEADVDRVCDVLCG